MNQQKKELLLSIIELEAKIKLAKKQKELDRQYFAEFYDRHQTTIVASLLPALVIGWKGGKMVRGKPIVKNFAKYGFVTLINLFRSFNKLK